ncbi:hypothetical protein A3E14_00345 [Candidatus Curtissbacteria bacterium RIFCSPHIGHO2_12_FULL_41_13]|nr:MAG: hypothetical protein A3E14_00345 [Candidatus Curtissbacteria bacterium RIFCSPHIGHO2_12_FULL_41_13]
MLSYQQKQLLLFEKLEKQFKQAQTPTTLVIPSSNYVNDKRICLTCVVFIPENLQRLILKEIIKPLKNADPSQYYYLPQSLHLTIQNIRTINLPPLFIDDDIEKVKTVFAQIIPKYQAFEFNLEGLFELPTGISIRGFTSEVLGHLVMELRDNLKRVGVADNKTYSSEIVFGNISVCRYYFKKPNLAFFRKVKELKKIKVGKMKIEAVSLITANCVCHPNLTKILKEYNLLP